jgi:hypothetical protein
MVKWNPRPRSDYEQAERDVEAQRLQLHQSERAIAECDPVPWNPALPYRSLSGAATAALNACEALSRSDLEAVLTRGNIAITGVSASEIHDGPLYRIERDVARARKVAFCFAENWILGNYWPKRRISGRLLPVLPVRKFLNVRVHWPELVRGLQEASFDIGLVENTNLSIEKKADFVHWAHLEKDKHDRFPPRDPVWKGPDRKSISEWAKENGLTRATAVAWAREYKLTQSVGAPKKDSAQRKS